MERSAREVAPHDAGMSRAAVDAIERAMRGLYDTGTQPAIALCLRRRGHVVFDRAIGEAQPGQTATPDTPFCVFSASKAVTAMIIHLLDGRNLLRIDDPVAEYIPEFARHGKEHTTIRHVLTHRAGIPSLAGHADPSLLGDWDHIVRLLCDAHPVSVPGRRLAYHAITGGFVLGEIVRRVTGKSVRQVLQEEVTEPLGLRWFNYGVRPEDMHAVARNAFTGPPVPKGLAYLVERALGVPCTFFQLLLDGGELDGVRVFDAKTVQRARTESSYLEVDLTLGLPVRYGLGLMLAGNHFSPFGPRTPQAFGHYGFINIVGWADPQRELSCALLTSGKPFLGTHLIAFWKLLASIAKSVPD